MMTNTVCNVEELGYESVEVNSNKVFIQHNFSDYILYI